MNDTIIVEVEPDEPITTEKVMEAYVDGRVSLEDKWVKVFTSKPPKKSSIPIVQTRYRAKLNEDKNEGTDTNKE